MLSKTEISYVLACKANAYGLLMWAVKGNTLTHMGSHGAAPHADDAAAWLCQNQHALPPAFRPTDAELMDVARLFASFLEVSFRVVDRSEWHLYSPEAHCFCPLCSWLVMAPRLRTRKLRSADKRRGRLFLLEWLQEQAPAMATDTLQAMLSDRDFLVDVATAAYARDLWDRMHGRSDRGPVGLALWRLVAWTETGAPKRGFRLKAKQVVAAQERVVQGLPGLRSVRRRASLE